ncbi:MAG TPA: CBS domain-containing protein [Verrucomicrobiae bacterium]|nr:CBS domain-containing protein [Verrucomicrobiae bacterium]
MHIILNYDKIYDDGQYSIMLPRLDYIKQARLKLGVTQRKLAFLCGVSTSMINQIESGRCKPSYDTAKRIFEILLSMESSMSIKAGDICNKNLITIQHEESLSVAIHKMRDHSISQLPVFDGLRRLVGILTEDNVAKIMIEHSDIDINLVKILSVMEPPPPLVDASTPAKALVSLVRFAKCVMVSEKGAVIGIITLTDTLKIIEFA